MQVSGKLPLLLEGLIAPYIEPDSNMKKNSRITKSESILFGIILLGIGVVEFQHLSFYNIKSMIFATLAVLTTAISHPLGNRQIIIINQSSGKLNTDERILAMLFSSFPTLLVCSSIGLIRSVFPSTSQVCSSCFIALCSGVVASYLFFLATQFVHKNLRKLAVVEAIQSLEVIFSVILGGLLLKDSSPNLAY
ncbi:multidrug resistance efflux transporter family protein [Enterococcus durans]|uniref:multidrug resistance efflux transporter family protein n=1 Tax=Enterococcus durans TaxID=53345 RepID=UPI0039A435EE